MSKKSNLELLDDPDFKDLCRQKNGISIVLTVIELVAYFGFIFLIAFRPDILSMDIAEGITLGIPIGIGVIIISWVLTGIYVNWANNKYDVLVEKVKSKVGG